MKDKPLRRLMHPAGPRSVMRQSEHATICFEDRSIWIISSSTMFVSSLEAGAGAGKASVPRYSVTSASSDIHHNPRYDHGRFMSSIPYLTLVFPRRLVILFSLAASTPFSRLFTALEPCQALTYDVHNLRSQGCYGLNIQTITHPLPWLYVFVVGLNNGCYSLPQISSFCW